MVDGEAIKIGILGAVGAAVMGYMAYMGWSSLYVTKQLNELCDSYAGVLMGENISTPMGRGHLVSVVTELEGVTAEVETRVRKSWIWHSDKKELLSRVEGYKGRLERGRQLIETNPEGAEEFLRGFREADDKLAYLEATRQARSR